MPNHSLLRNTIRRGGHRSSRGGAALLGVVLFCTLGCFWVWKESLHERVASRLLVLEKQEQAALNVNSNLKRALLSAVDFANLEGNARARLGMTFPKSSPDTVWMPKNQPEQQLGVISFFKLDLKGVGL